MNQRIRELAEQANLTIATSSLWEHKVQEFAELIVKECAEIADVERPSSLGCGYITKTKGMLIKEHFGVKE
jgi:hypothetical protein